MISSYKTIGVSRDENNIKYKNINNKTKTFRNSILINNSSVERFERGYATNLSCSKIRSKNSYNGNESKNLFGFIFVDLIRNYKIRQGRIDRGV
mgnify:CR=1 FL=1